jgi:hypothetical protein
VTTLVAPWRPLIVSLEMLNPARGEAERTRFAPKLPAAGPRLGLSDLLLYAPRDSAPPALADVWPRALHSMRLPGNRAIGVFWEVYGTRAQNELVDYTLLVTPQQSILRRALVKAHVLAPDQSVSLQWREVPSIAGGIASRGVTMDLSRLKPGAYSVRLMLTSGTDVPIVAERTVEIL